MSQRRYRALLIGNWHYPSDPANLPDLKGPLNDVSRLAEALTDPVTGLFTPPDVSVLTERDSHDIAASLEQLFAAATRDEMLLIYYSGHGLTAYDNGSLLLCGRNTRTDRKLATTVNAETVDRMMRYCPAAAIVIVLDCCYSGAFKTGDMVAELAGRGRYIMAAGRPRDRTRDADHASGLSRFTAHLLHGIRGAAGIPDADHISVSDLYRYVHRQMTVEGPVIPQRRFDGDGDILIARRPVAVGRRPHTASGFRLSAYRIDITDVRPDETLPPEHIEVHGTSNWLAECAADWISIDSSNTSFVVTLAPGSAPTVPTSTYAKYAAARSTPCGYQSVSTHPASSVTRGRHRPTANLRRRPPPARSRTVPPQLRPRRRTSSADRRCFRSARTISSALVWRSPQTGAFSQLAGPAAYSYGMSPPADSSADRSPTPAPASAAAAARSAV
ncbi:hypothetical protein Phou_090400 [Phytohabitans houttuyneae]|uniref:Peptidase C14 caspase domain-containing protein n=1 Tax=Phytohabitans houttuyneae TaxID=1076126 RepID=A0A6V8KN99_9ACTN|nr:hypothetical protein Phou_090400 [Phytohabitans houttuyneae]